MDIQASATNHNNVLPDMQHRLFDERWLRVPALELEDLTLDLYLGACVLHARHRQTLRSPMHS